MLHAPPYMQRFRPFWQVRFIPVKKNKDKERCNNNNGHACLEANKLPDLSFRNFETA